MKNKLISTTEVKKHYILADLLGRQFRTDYSPSQKEIKEKFIRLKETLWATSESEVDSKLNEIRMARYEGLYDSLNWTLENVALSEMGPYPGMSEINYNFTTDSIQSTATKINGHGTGRATITSTNEQEKNLQNLLKKIGSMEKVLSFLYENLPLILVPGGTQREQFHNAEIKDKKDPLCRILNYDIDDGNSRALLYAIHGLETASSLVGRKK